MLCNLDDIDPGALARSIAEIFLTDAFPEPVDTTTAAAPRSVSLPAQELQRYVGFYRDLSDDSVGRIFTRNGKLMASADGSESGGYELTPIGPNRFVIVGTPIVAEFLPPAKDRPQELHVTGAGTKPLVSQLITHPFTPSTEQLRAFEGTYTSDEVHGTYMVVARDSALLIEIPTEDNIPLLPVFTDAFVGRGVGVVKFSRNARGVVTAFTTHAAGMRGLRFDLVR